MAVCYRHPNRETGVSCSNCGRPICTECMTPTSVGMRCPECARQRTQARSMPRRSPGSAFARDFDWRDPKSWHVTHVLIAINIIIFLWEVAGGTRLTSGQPAGWAYLHGVLYGPCMTGGGCGVSGGNHQYWRLLTSGFLHASIWHVGLNMLSLWFVGRSLEPAVGRLYFGSIYFAALLAGSFGALIFEPQQPTLGASGAIFGIFGALIMFARGRGVPLWQSGLLPMLLFNLIYTITIAGVSIGGHIGGVIAGVATGWVLSEYGDRRDRRSLVLGACLLVAVISVVGSLLVAGGTGLTPHGWTL